MSGNPMLKVDTLKETLEDGRKVTISGAINKTTILVGLVALSAYYTWNVCANGFMDKANILLYGGIIAGIILFFITIFNPKASPITTPAYALCEGLALGSVSYMYGSVYNGIVLNAILITISTMLAMLFLYRSRIIRVTPQFQKVILIATVGVALFYLAGIVGAFLGHPMTIFNGGMMGIAVSLLICVIAAFNFALDFHFIENASDNLPAYYEWYGAFGLLVTLIWFYLEVLRLLAQLASRDE